MSRARLALVSVLLVGGVAGATPCPNIMLVLDRSGSMEDPPDSSTTQSKWEILQAAVRTIVTKWGDQVPFGLEMFTPDSYDTDAECYNSTKIDVEPAHGTGATIISDVNAAMPDSITNTGEAIKRVYVDPVMKDASRGQFIILITDGDPNCNSGEGSNAAYTVSEISNAAAKTPPILTFVIGFDGNGSGGGVDPDNLNRMAQAGKEPQAGCNNTSTNPCYYSASDPTKLNDALDKIINQVTGGEFGTSSCDDSCFSNGCPAGQVCTVEEINPTPHCEADPCAGVVGTCDAGEFCRQGQCVPACLTACGTGQKCVDGDCVADPCANPNCQGDTVCDPTTGACVANQCTTATNCPASTACNPVTGNCEANQCLYIACPTGTVCQAGGNCESTSSSSTGPGIHGRSSVGCAVSPGQDLHGAALAFGLLALLALVERRRRR